MALHEYPDLEQGSEPWLELRRGMVTASTVGQLLSIDTLGAESFACPLCLTEPGDLCKSVAKGREGSPLKTMHSERSTAAREAAVTTVEPARNDTSQRLTLSLVAERITGLIEPVFMNDDMWRGRDLEPVARDMYAKHMAEEQVTTTGFLVRDDWGFSIGASPDGLVGDWGGIEIKAPRAKAHIATILADEVPAQHMAQIQTCLLVTGREWWDFVSYFGGLRPYVKRVYADPKWAEAIVNAVSAFEQRAEEMTHTYLDRTAGLPDTEPYLVNQPVELKLA